MRALASALALFALSSPGAPAGQVAFVRNGTLEVHYVNARVTRPIVEHVAGPVGFAGNGRTLSAGARIPGIRALPTTAIAWAPDGERAAYQARDGSVWTWEPVRTRRILSASWGATSLGWGPDGRLALGRSVCHVPCGVPKHQEVWIWRAGRLTRVAGPLPGVQRPVVRGFDSRGRVLWWSDLEDSASIAADGLPLYANRARITVTLPFPEYVVPCAAGLVVAAGTDRYTMHAKRLLLDGRDLSQDASRSWVSPDCRGDTIVAAASRNAVPRRIGDEHRVIWELQPQRRQLTRPPAHASDENPRLLADGSLVFVRTVRGRGKLMLLRDGTLRTIASLGASEDYYGHYDWAQRFAVWP